MSALETEEEEYSPKWILAALAAVAIVVLVGVAAALTVPLQPGLGGGGARAASGSIVIPSNAAVQNFFPVNVTVYMGINNTVQWTNEDAIQHTVVVCPVGGGSLCSISVSIAHSLVLSHGDTFQVTLNATGTYHYYCSIHPNTMRATIVVMAQPSSTTT